MLDHATEAELRPLAGTRIADMVPTSLLAALAATVAVEATMTAMTDTLELIPCTTRR